jgi:hypothetical protein
MKQEPNAVTGNLLHLCYTCDHAHLCDTEAASISCWTDKEIQIEEELEFDETRELLRLYAM